MYSPLLTILPMWYVYCTFKFNSLQVRGPFWGCFWYQVRGRGVCPGVGCVCPEGGYPPPSLTLDLGYHRICLAIGWYASYWNAFLFYLIYYFNFHHNIKLPLKSASSLHLCMDHFLFQYHYLFPPETKSSGCIYGISSSY